MSERSERLFRALSEIDGQKIDEAAPTAKKRFHWKRWGALAAALVLVIGVGSQVLPWLGGGSNNTGAGGSGTDGGSTFMSYAGPVFPLTLKEADSAVTAEREITMDIRQWSDWIFQWGMRVTDAYTLTSTSQEDKTVSLLYPFVANLQELWRYQPALTAEGQELKAVLHAGPYAGRFAGAGGPEDEGRWNLAQLDSWEGYKALLSDGSYQQSAFEDYPDLSDIPVTVYRLTAPWVKDGESYTAPSVRVSFTLDFDRTQVLSYGFNSFEQDQERDWMGLGVFLSQARYSEKAGAPAGTIIVLGDDIGEITVVGGRRLDWDEENLPEGGVTIQRQETDLDSALREISRVRYDQHIENYAQDNFWDISNVDFEMYHGMLKENLVAYGILSPTPAERYDDGRLDDLDFVGMDRVFYLEAEITVPARGSVTLTADMVKAPSYDFYCAHTENQGVHGYDMVTKLGSNLACTGQTAVLVDSGQFEIVRQNFGFDLENGVTRVALDPEQEHYYLEVKRSLS